MQALIKSYCFTEKWLTSKTKEVSGDPTLIEKTVHAFALLGYLVQLEENFIFKGGTSLLLQVPEIKRLSIDIDIIFGGDIEKFISKLEKIPGNNPFIRFEENEREFRSLPNRRHFKFFYNSSLSAKEEYVLLDIVMENPDYIPFVETKKIKTNLFEIETKLFVKIPTIEGLLGDKLTAFAPHTIGVPFIKSENNSTTMQVIKQLYDIGELFDIATNFEHIEKAYNATFEKENEYRDNKFTREEVLQDTINVCLNLLQIRLKKYRENNISNYLEDGIKRIASHLIGDKFTTDSKAKITAAKTFCIANLLLTGEKFDFQNDLYQEKNIEKLAKINLPEPYIKLNRLKPILPEAFYYICSGIKNNM